MFISVRSRTAAAAASAATGLYLHRRWSEWNRCFERLELPRDSLLVGYCGRGTSVSTPVAVCTGVPTERLPALGIAVASGGSNYARIEGDVLQQALDRLHSAYAETAGVAACSCQAVSVRTQFGVERMVDSSGEPVWLGVSVREPRWVGDEQLVMLCAGQPSGSTAVFPQLRAQLLLSQCVQRVLDPQMQIDWDQD